MLSPTRSGTPLLVSVLVAGVLAGCTGGSSDDGSFVLPSSDGACQEHQLERPGVDYTGGEDGDTAQIFTLLKYWTANGDKPYCDGEPPSEIDEEWAELVAQLQDGEPAPQTPVPSGSTT